MSDRLESNSLGNTPENVKKEVLGLLKNGYHILCVEQDNFIVFSRKDTNEFVKIFLTPNEEAKR